MKRTKKAQAHKLAPTFEHKLAKYAMVGGALLGAPFAAKAGVVYYQLPVTTITGVSAGVVANNYSWMDFSMEPGQHDLSIEVEATTTGSGGNYGGWADLYADGYTRFMSLGPIAAGTVIGPADSFPSTSGRLLYADNGWTWYTPCKGCAPQVNQYPVNVDNGGTWPSSSNPSYLGLEFSRNGQTFYGWAELYVWINLGNSQYGNGQPFVGAGVVSDAFNNTPGASILAGQTASADAGGGAPPADTPEPSSLALFAIGGAAVLALRRRRSAAK